MYTPFLGTLDLFNTIQKVAQSTSFFWEQSTQTYCTIEKVKKNNLKKMEFQPRAIYSTNTGTVLKDSEVTHFFTQGTVGCKSR